MMNFAQAGYKDLVERDALEARDKMSKTFQMIADRRKERGYKLEETFNEVSFQWKNLDFLLKNLDFLIKNLDFCIKPDGYERGWRA